MNAPEDFLPVAGYALGKFSGDQLYFPNAGDATVLSWAETFAHSKLTDSELRAGVIHLALNADSSDFRPMPADIIRAAKAARLELLKQIPEAKRRDMDEASHLLQEMGFTPQQAHRWTRARVLQQPCDVEVTADQEAELWRRLADRKELTDAQRLKGQKFMAAIGKLANVKAIGRAS